MVSEYDAHNRLRRVHETARTGIDPFSFTADPQDDRTTGYAYDLAGRVRSKQLPNGQRTLTSYDGLGRTLLLDTVNTVPTLPVLVSRNESGDSAAGLPG